MDEKVICFQLCGDRDNPSVSVSDTAYCIPANPMSDRGQAVCIALEGNGARPSHKGSGYSEEGKMFTLNTIENHAVCYGVCSFASNSMMSDNPHSGFYEAKTSRTLDLNCGNPACNQGGTLVVQCVEGQSCCTDTEKAFTLQAGRPDDHHIPDVCYPRITGALCANSHPGSYTGQDAFNDMLPVYKHGRKYIVRRLTPVECARLQGFPDWWTDGVDGSDSAVFKMWGNGIALPCAADVLGRIAKEAKKEEIPFSEPSLPEKGCWNCLEYNGDFCTKFWNDLDESYKVTWRDEKKPDDCCEDWDYDESRSEDEFL